MLPQFGHSPFSAKFDSLGVVSSIEGPSAVTNAFLLKSVPVLQHPRNGLGSAEWLFT
jgi:hypothetical protein